MSMQMSILIPQISMQLSIFEMCLTKKKKKQQQPFTGLKGSALNILVPDTIAHPQGATGDPALMLSGLLW